MTVGRLTQAVVEVLSDGTPKARLTQEVVEILSNGTPKARLTQAVVEVLSTVAVTVPTPINRINVVSA